MLQGAAEPQPEDESGENTAAANSGDENHAAENNQDEDHESNEDATRAAGKAGENQDGDNATMNIQGENHAAGSTQDENHENNTEANHATGDNQGKNEAAPENDNVFYDIKQKHRSYVNLVRGLLREYNPNVVLVMRDSMSPDDWDRLKQQENDSDALQVMIKSCKKEMMWPEKQKFPKSSTDENDVDEKCRGVKQFWRRVELALPRSFKPIETNVDSGAGDSNV